jgi:hypothetical protein
MMCSLFVPLSGRIQWKSHRRTAPRFPGKLCSSRYKTHRLERGNTPCPSEIAAEINALFAGFGPPPKEEEVQYEYEQEEVKT